MSSRNLSNYSKFIRNNLDSNLIFDYYEYHICKSPRDKPNFKYLQCVLHKKEGCRARGTLNGGVFTFSKKFHTHNHLPDPDASDRLAFLQELQRRSSSELCTSYGQIFSCVIDEERFRKFDREMQFIQLVQRMRDWRNKSTLPQPKTYVEIEQVLGSQRWKALLKHKHGEIFMNSITARDGKTAALFATRDVAARMPAIEVLYLNTNSLVLPDVHNTQRVMLITGVFKQRALTFGWVLFNDESRDLFRAVVQAIKIELIVRETPLKIITNYDWRLVTSIRPSFPLLDVAPSFCDFILTILNFAHQQRGVDLENEQHVQILTKFIANYLSSAPTIRLGFEWIVGCLNQQNLYAIFRPIMEWYSDTFLSELVPESNNYFKKEHLLMNGTVRIPQRLKGKIQENPSAQWAHYKAHLEIVDSAVQDLSTLISGDKKSQKNISMSPRLLPCIRLTLLRRLWQLLESNQIEFDRFIQTVSGMLKPLIKKLIYQRQFLSGNYCPIPPAEIPEDPVIMEAQRAELRNVRTCRDPAGLFTELNLTEVQRLIRANIQVPQGIVQALIEDAEILEDEQLDIDENFVDFRQREWRCIKCNTQLVEMLCKGCSHIVLCQACSIVLRNEAAEAQTGLLCPECNVAVSTFDKVYIGHSEDPIQPLNWICTVCMEDPITHMGIECKHISLCHSCASCIIRQDDHKGCPQCRNDNRNDNANPKPFIPVKFRQIKD